MLRYRELKCNRWCCCRIAEKTATSNSISTRPTYSGESGLSPCAHIISFATTLQTPGQHAAFRAGWNCLFLLRIPIPVPWRGVPAHSPFWQTCFRERVYGVRIVHRRSSPNIRSSTLFDVNLPALSRHEVAAIWSSTRAAKTKNPKTGKEDLLQRCRNLFSV